MRWKKLAVALAAIATSSLLLIPAANAGDDTTDGRKPESDVGVLAVREGCRATGFDTTHGGKIDVYVGYTSANGGTNCAWAEKHKGWSAKEQMGVYLFRCTAAADEGDDRGTPGHRPTDLNRN